MAEIWGGRLQRTHQALAVAIVREIQERNADDSGHMRVPHLSSSALRALQEYSEEGLLDDSPLLSAHVVQAMGLSATSHLETVLRKALAPDPEDRYNSASEMLADVLLCSASPRFSRTISPAAASVELRLEKLNNCGLILLRDALLDWVRDAAGMMGRGVVIRIESFDAPLSEENLQTTSEILAALCIGYSVQVYAGGVLVNLARAHLVNGLKDEALLCAFYFAAAVTSRTHEVTYRLCSVLHEHNRCPLRELDLDGVILSEGVFRSVSNLLDSLYAPDLDTLSLNRTGQYPHAWCLRLSGMLRNNTCLRALRIDQNGIDCNGGKLLAAALFNNLTLMELSAAGNPFTADVASAFARAQSAVAGRVVCVQWLALRINLAAPDFEGGCLMAELKPHAQRNVFRFVRPEELEMDEGVHVPHVSKLNAAGAAFGHARAKSINQAHFSQIQELFNAEGCTAFQCDQACTLTPVYIRSRYVPKPLLRFVKEPLPLCLVPVALQAEDTIALAVLPALREFFDNLIAVHPRPVHLALRYACLLDFVAEYHLMVADKLKEEASTYKKVAARIVSELPLKVFERLMHDPEITELTLECSCMQLAGEARFTYLVMRLWTGSLTILHDQNRACYSSTDVASEGTWMRWRLCSVPAWFYFKAHSPRFRFFAFIMSHLGMTLYMHWVLFHMRSGNLKTGLNFQMLFTVSQVLYKMTQLWFSPHMPVVMVQNRQALRYRDQHAAVLQRALERGVSLSAMYERKLTSDFWHYSWNYLDVFVCSCYVFWWFMIWQDWPHNHMLMLLSFTLMFLWIRMASVMSVIPRCAHMVMQFQILMQDFVPWLGFFLISIVAFSTTLFALQSRENDPQCVESLPESFHVIWKASLYDFSATLDCLFGNNEYVMIGCLILWISVASTSLFSFLISIFCADYRVMGSDSQAFINLDRLRLIREYHLSSDINALPPPLNLVMLVFWPIRMFRHRRSARPRRVQNPRSSSTLLSKRLRGRRNKHAQAVGWNLSKTRSMKSLKSQAGEPLNTRQLANLQGALGNCEVGDEHFDASEEGSFSRDSDDEPSDTGLERIRTSLHNELRALLEKGSKGSLSIESSRIERHLTSADRAGLMALLQSREQAQDQQPESHRLGRNVSTMSAAAVSMSAAAVSGEVSSGALSVELAARKRQSIKQDENATPLSVELAARKRTSVKLNGDWDGLTDRRMTETLTTTAALPIPEEEWNNEEFADLLADLISEFGQSGSAGTGDIDAGDVVLRKLQELSVYVHIRDWAESFALQGPGGMSGTSWQAMRLSLRVFRRVEMPMMPFSTIRRIIGEERGVGPYALLEHVGRTGVLTRQLVADQANLSQRTRRIETALEGATCSLRTLSDGIAELRRHAV